MDDYLGSGSIQKCEDVERVTSPLPILDSRHLVLSLDDLNRRVPIIRKMLTERDRREIRARALLDGKMNLRAVAREYNVSRETVARALGRRKRSDGTYAPVPEIPT